jgi:hypothetical protein
MSEQALIIRHYSILNGSGMHHAAKSMAEAEQRLGHDSLLVDIDKPESPSWVNAEDADVHVIHTHLPDVLRARSRRMPAIVFVAHGTPEHVVENAIDAAQGGGYGPADGWMMLREHLRTADAVLTFWERHAAIYRSMVPKERPIHCIPMGVDTAYWAGGTDHGHFAGTPAVWMSENQHRMKWALDTLIAWPWVTERVPEARLHAHYIPNDMHRFFIDLANSNGAAFKSYLSGGVFTHENLRNMWKSCDFFLGPVRFGDHNCLSMQAAAAGIPTISYRGNLYADYWITEGDQRQMALELAAILKGEVTPRSDKRPVPTLEEMATAAVDAYRIAITRARPSGYVPPKRLPPPKVRAPLHVRRHFEELVARNTPVAVTNATKKSPRPTRPSKRTRR